MYIYTYIKYHNVNIICIWRNILCIYLQTYTVYVYIIYIYILDIYGLPKYISQSSQKPCSCVNCSRLWWGMMQKFCTMKHRFKHDYPIPSLGWFWIDRQLWDVWGCFVEENLPNSLQSWQLFWNLQHLHRLTYILNFLVWYRYFLQGSFFVFRLIEANCRDSPHHTIVAKGTTSRRIVFGNLWNVNPNSF